MLKPVTSRYNDNRRGQRWVKLKKDFIPGAGDTLDFLVVGASWQKRRARELLGQFESHSCSAHVHLCSQPFELATVPPSVYTTFFVGLEADDLGAHLSVSVVCFFRRSSETDASTTHSERASGTFTCCSLSRTGSIADSSTSFVTRSVGIDLRYSTRANLARVRFEKFPAREDVTPCTNLR